MKVGIFGGSFSPVHTGHMAVATAVVANGLADEVWMMPCRRNPLKDGSGLLPDTERLEMLTKAVDYQNRIIGGEKLKICDYEISRPGPSYTADTLRHFVEIHPDKKFRLIMGADSFLGFTKWKDWVWIKDNFSPIIYPRPGYPLNESGPEWTPLKNVKLVDISSTQLRKSLASGERSLEYMPWL